MSEYVKHHVEEEQNEMFPMAKSTRLDLRALGTRLMERKESLMGVGPETLEAKAGLHSIADALAERSAE